MIDNTDRIYPPLPFRPRIHGNHEESIGKVDVPNLVPCLQKHLYYDYEWLHNFTQLLGCISVGLYTMQPMFSF